MFSWLDIRYSFLWWCQWKGLQQLFETNFLKCSTHTLVSPSFQIYHACVEAMSNEVYVLLWVNHLNEWVKSKQKVVKTWIPQTQHTGHNYTEHNTISVWKSSLVLLAAGGGGWWVEKAINLFVVCCHRCLHGRGWPGHGQVSRVRSVWSPRAGAMLWTWKQERCERNFVLFSKFLLISMKMLLF